MFHRYRQAKRAAGYASLLLMLSILAAFWFYDRIRLEIRGIRGSAIVENVDIRQSKPENNTLPPVFVHKVSCQGSTKTLTDSKRYEPGTRLSVVYLPNSTKVENVETLTPLVIPLTALIVLILLTCMLINELVWLLRDIAAGRTRRRVYETDLY
jgi:hypothetical protein